MAEATDEWWEVFHDAQTLRERWRDVVRNMTHEQKRDALAAIKREALELLQRLEAPHPLWALIAELWGWESFAPRLPGQVVYPERDGLVQTEDLFLRAARIEAHTESPLPLKELSRRLNHELSERHGDLHRERDYTKSLRTWRKRADYKALIWSLTRHPLDC